MATGIRIWEISDDVPHGVDSSALELEAKLERWMVSNPEIIGGHLLIIDRQRLIPGVGKFDLLAMDEDGTLIVIELKRDRTAREAVAQALDYASWLESADAASIAESAKAYLKKPLEEAFWEHFEQEIPEWSCQNHRITLVAPRLDASAERIITYLSEKHQVDINAVFFQYVRLSDDKQILARTMLLSEGTVVNPNQPTEDVLLAKATKMGTRSLVDICRSVADVWTEQPRRTYGGSFRYWATTALGKDRVVFGINIQERWEHPYGLAVWLPIAALAELGGQTEERVRVALDTLPVVDRGKKDYWIRLATDEQARALVQQLRGFLQTTSQATA